MTIENGLIPDAPIAESELIEAISTVLKFLEPDDLIGILKITNDAYRMSFGASQKLDHSFEQLALLEGVEIELPDVDVTGQRNDTDGVNELDVRDGAKIESAGGSGLNGNGGEFPKLHYVLGEEFHMEIFDIHLVTNRVYAKNVDSKSKVYINKSDQGKVAKKLGWYAFESAGLLIYAITIQEMGGDCLATVGRLDGNGSPVITSVRQYGRGLIEFCKNCVILGPELRAKKC